VNRAEQVPACAHRDVLMNSLHKDPAQRPLMEQVVESLGGNVEELVSADVDDRSSDIQLWSLHSSIGNCLFRLVALSQADFALASEHLSDALSITEVTNSVFTARRITQRLLRAQVGLLKVCKAGVPCSVCETAFNS